MTSVITNESVAGEAEGRGSSMTVRVNKDEFAVSEREFVCWRCLPQALGGVSDSTLSDAGGTLEGSYVAQHIGVLWYVSS